MIVFLFNNKTNYLNIPICISASVKKINAELIIIIIIPNFVIILKDTRIKQFFEIFYLQLFPI